MKLMHAPARNRWLRNGLVALAIAIPVAVGAGCGAGTGTSSGAGPADTASFMPAGTPVYVEASTDFSSQQWTQALALAQRFPGYADVARSFNRELASGGVSFTRDVAPLLGSHAAIGVSGLGKARGDGGQPDVTAAVEIASGKENDVIAFAQRGNKGLTKAGTHGGVDYYSGHGAFLAVDDGAAVITNSRDALFNSIDAHAAGGDRTLASSAKLKDAFSKLPDQVLAQAFVDVGAVVSDVSQNNADAKKKLDQAGIGEIGSDASVALSVAAEQDGVRVKGVVDGVKDLATADEFTPTLLKSVPADAIAYVGIHDLAGKVGKLVDVLEKSNPDLKKQIDQATGQLLPMLGVPLSDISALFSMEQAVVVTAGSPVPSVTLALQVADGTKAKSTLDKLRERGTALANLAGKGIPAFHQVPLANGVTGFESNLSKEAGIVYGVDGNLALIGTSAAGIREVQRATPSLDTSPDFQAATRQMPSKVTAVVWLNIDRLVAALRENGKLASTDPKVLANVAPLKSIAAWGTGGADPGFELFATIQ
ncbi:MAG TPA: DUF3352 domain-containing protein [Miltoncostaeaceae bacterium]|nr:DUF3352 domain-containing protein [Miltoncostaeaceae bacterium]